MRLIECVPNFSEGRDASVVNRIRAAIADSRSTRVLDWSSDASHNRSVITFIAPPDAVADAAFNAIAAAGELIDMRVHRGVHPRIGAADVVPFVPLGGVTMEECVETAVALGERVGRELEIPVYLYGAAATRPERRVLANVRRGQLEGLSELIAVDPDRAPDFGPRRMHPTAGAVSIGARKILVAFNVHIGDSSALPVARQVARAVRESSGGLPGVRALALEVDGQAQVSMNLVDLEVTSVADAFAAVKHEAERHGAHVTWSELIGLIPEHEVDAAAARALALRDFHEGRVLDRRVRETALAWAAGDGAESGSVPPEDVSSGAALHDGRRLDSAIERLLLGVQGHATGLENPELLLAIAEVADASGRNSAAAALRAAVAAAKE